MTILELVSVVFLFRLSDIVVSPAWSDAGAVLFFPFFLRGATYPGILSVCVCRLISRLATLVQHEGLEKVVPPAPLSGAAASGRSSAVSPELSRTADGLTSQQAELQVWQCTLICLPYVRAVFFRIGAQVMVNGGSVSFS